MNDNEVTIQEIPEVSSEKLKIPKFSKSKSKAASLDEEVKVLDEEPKKNKKPTVIKNKTTDVDAVARQLQGVHVMLAMITKIPEFQISEQESQMLAKSLAEVQKEFGIHISGKTAALVGLIGTGAMIYLPRAPIITHRFKEAQAFANAKKVENAEHTES